MPSKKPPMYWMGHPVRDEKHARDLHMKAALYEFHEGMGREKAEQRVVHEDKTERHEKAAAHHLEGIKAAHAIGNMDDAQRHHDMYSLHMKALGHEPGGPVPQQVSRHRDAEDWKNAYGFKSHADDNFLVQPVKKAEDDGWEPKNPHDSPIGPLDHARIHRGIQPGNDPQGPQPKLGHNPLDQSGPGPWMDPHGDPMAHPEMPAGGPPMAQSDDEFHTFLDEAKNPAARQKLLAYLANYGMGAKELGELAGFETHEGGGQTSAPKYGHLRVVKAEDLLSIIGLARLTKGVGDRVKQFNVEKTFLRSKHQPEDKAFDYSSWLTPEQHQAGYHMFVLSHGQGNPVRVHVVRAAPGARYQERVGGAHGNVENGDLMVEKYHLTGQGHQNKGIEGSMLNALMGHAKRHLGAASLSHAAFTPEASGFIEAVAKPHGLQLGEPEDIDEGEEPVDREPMQYATGGVKMRSQTRPKPKTPMWWASEDEAGDFRRSEDVRHGFADLLKAAIDLLKGP